jgi:hypothetical protein
MSRNKVACIMGFSPSKPIDFNKVCDYILSLNKEIKNPIILSYASKELLRKSLRSRTKKNISSKLNKEYNFIKNNINIAIKILNDNLNYKIYSDEISLDEKINIFVNSLNKNFFENIKNKSEEYVYDIIKSKCRNKALSEKDINERIDNSCYYIFHELSHFHNLFQNIKLSGYNEIIIFYPGDIKWLLDLIVINWKEFENIKINCYNDCKLIK